MAYDGTRLPLPPPHPHHTPPTPRSVLQSLGVRDAVLALLEEREEEDDVKQQALLATSKMMVRSWRFVGSDGGAKVKNSQ